MSTKDEVLARWADRAGPAAAVRLRHARLSSRERVQLVATCRHVYALTGRTRHFVNVGWQREGRCANCGTTTWSDPA